MEQGGACPEQGKGSLAMATLGEAASSSCPWGSRPPWNRTGAEGDIAATGDGELHKKGRDLRVP
jgi:hypothetical protein